MDWASFIPSDGHYSSPSDTLQSMIDELFSTNISVTPPVVAVDLREDDEILSDTFFDSGDKPEIGGESGNRGTSKESANGIRLSSSFSALSVDQRSLNLSNSHLGAKIADLSLEGRLDPSPTRPRLNHPGQLVFSVGSSKR